MILLRTTSGAINPDDWDILWDAARRGKHRKLACQSVYGDYLRSALWRANSQPAWNRARGRCERCKLNFADECHHKHYRSRFRELPEDLIVLCRGCHEFVHGLSADDPKDWRASRQRDFWERGAAA